ncbi:MAG: putative MFS-type transporter YhjX [Syntrophomonadaceae bacterium]|nr:putative MFS-type transporter YhjX [Bacillota bacterium]
MVTDAENNAAAPNYVISRWSIPLAGFLLSSMGGISYAWGVFIVPLEQQFGWSRASAALPVSIYLFVFTTVGMIFGGALQDKAGPRKVAAAGGILFFIGYLLAAQVERFPFTWWLPLTYGVISGLGCALAYCVTVPTARKWFPDKPALAISVSVTGFGLAAVIFAPWITSLIHTIGISNTFLVLGALTSAVTLFAAWLIRLPLPGWTPQGWSAASNNASIPMYDSRTEATLAEALKSPVLYFIWLGLFSVILGGLIAMTHIVPYGISILGLEKPLAALASVFFGVANGFGRTIAGLIAEKFGAVRLMLVTYPVVAVTFLLFNTVATTAATLYACALIFGFGFAVTLGLFPLLTTVAFGAANLGAIYGVVVTAFGLAAFLGPIAAAWIYDLTQTYVLPFFLAGIFVIAGWLISLFAFKLKYKLP